METGSGEHRRGKCLPWERSEGQMGNEMTGVRGRTEQERLLSETVRQAVTFNLFSPSA